MCNAERENQKLQFVLKSKNLTLLYSYAQSVLRSEFKRKIAHTHMLDCKLK